MTTFTPELQELRRHTLGASEVGIVLGLNPWQGELELWAVKKGLLQPFAGNAATERGNLLEPAVAAWYARETWCSLRGPWDRPFIHRTERWMSASPDRIVVDDAGDSWGLECKTSKYAEGWGTSGAVATGFAAAEIIPPAYAAQVLWSMEVCNLDRWDVAVLLMSDSDWRRYVVLRDKAEGAALIETGRAWWDRHIINGEQPDLDGSKAASRLLQQRFPRETGDKRQASAEEEALLRRLKELQQQANGIKDEESLIKRQLEAAIGEAKGLTSSIGSVSWSFQEASSYTVNREAGRTLRPYWKR